VAWRCAFAELPRDATELPDGWVPIKEEQMVIESLAAATERLLAEITDATGREHAPGGSPEGGEFVSKGGGATEPLDDAKLLERWAGGLAGASAMGADKPLIEYVRAHMRGESIPPQEVAAVSRIVALLDAAPRYSGWAYRDMVFEHGKPSPPWMSSGRSIDISGLSFSKSRTVASDFGVGVAGPKDYVVRVRVQLQGAADVENLVPQEWKFQREVVPKTGTHLKVISMKRVGYGESPHIFQVQAVQEP